MALDPLKFGVEIQDDATSKLNEIENVLQKVIASLEKVKGSHTVKIDMKGAASSTNIAQTLDPQKYSALQEVVDKIVESLTQLKGVFKSFNKDNGLDDLAKTLKTINETVGGLSATLSTLSNAFKFTASQQELEEYDKKIKALKDELAGLETKTKEAGEAAKVANDNMKTFGEGKSSEVTMLKNMDKLKAALSKIEESIARVEPARDAFAKAGLSDEVLEGKYQMLIKIRDALNSALKDPNTLSRPGALSTIMVDGDTMALGEQTKELRSKKGIDDLIKGFQNATAEAKHMEDAARRAFEEMNIGFNGTAPDTPLEEKLKIINTLLKEAQKFVTADMRWLNDLMKPASKEGIDTTSYWESYKQFYKQLLFIREQIKTSDLSDTETVKTLISQYGQLHKQVFATANLLNQQTLHKRAGYADEVERARIAYAWLNKHIDDYNIRRERMVKGGQDTTELDKHIQKAKEFLYVLDRIQKRGFYGNFNTYDILHSADFQVIRPNAWDEINKLAEEAKLEAKANKENLKLVEETRKANEQKNAEMAKAWDEYDKMQEKQSQQWARQQAKDEAERQKANDRRIADERRVADQGIRQAEREAEARAKAAQKATNDEIRQYERSREVMMNRARTLADNLYNWGQIQYARRGSFAGLDTTDLDNALNRVKAIYQELRSFQRTGVSDYGNSAQEIVNTMGLASAKEAVRSATQRLNAEERKANSQNNERHRLLQQLTAEEEKFARSLNHSTMEMQKQGTALSELKTLAKQYLGVWGAQQFFRNIIEIGGQLEKQRLSLGAILGDTAQAEQLFNNIKDLAVRSPFGVVELDQFTKQLSAYGFKYNELFDMTKRLADIAAGAGTDVSRLALALGHVRAEGALSGYTLRQFAMNNIPMVQKLSERLTELEGRIVSVADVRKRVRAKEIGYEDVEAVIKDLTNEGGMFFNMQETISDSVAAKFKNLRDSMDIMYGEMAKSSLGDALKAVATILTKLTREWKALLPVIATATAYFASQKLVMFGINAQITKYGLGAKVLTGETFKLTQQQVYNMAVTRQITRRQLLLAVATRRLTVEQAELAASTYGISRAQLAQVASSQKIDKALLANALSTSKYTVAQLRAMAAMKTGRTNMFTMGLMRMRLGWLGAWSAAKTFFTGVKAMSASIAWLFALEAAITLITKAWQKNQESKERADELAHKAREGYRNMATNAVNFKVGASVELDTTGLKTQIDKMKQELSEYSPQVGNTLAKAFAVDAKGKNVHSLAEQYEILAQEVLDTKNAYEELGKISRFFELANDETDGYFDESLRKNIEDYIKSLGEQKDAESDLLRFRPELNKQLEHTAAIYKNVGDLFERNAALYRATNGREGFKEDDTMAKWKAVKALNDEWMALATNPQTRTAALESKQYATLRDFHNAYTSMWQSVIKDNKELENSWGGFNSALANTSSKLEVVRKDAKIFTDDLVKRLEGQFGTTVNNFTAAQKRAVQLGLQEFLNAIPGFKDMAAKERQALEQSLLKPFNIKIDVEAEEAYQRLNDLQSYLRSITSKTWTVNIRNVETLEDVVEQQKKASKSAATNKKIAEGILKKAGVDTKAIEQAALQQFTDGLQPAVEESVSSVTDTPWSKNPGVPKNQKGKGDKMLEGILNQYAGNELVQEAVRTLADSISSEENRKILEKLGFDFSEDKKDKGNRNEDREAKKLREIAKLYKDAYDWYKKYVSQVGESAGLTKVQQQFQPLFDQFNKEWGTNLNLNDIPQYKENLELLLTTGQRLYETPAHRNSFMVDAIKQIRDAISDVDYTEAQRKMDEFASYIQTRVDGMTRSWDIYNSVREATGNRELAMRVAGVNSNQDRNLADNLRRQIERDLASSNVSGVGFDITLDDKKIEKLIMEAYNNSAPERNAGESDKEYAVRLAQYQEKIKGVIAEYKKWRDLQRDVVKTDITTFGQLLGSAQDYETSLKKIDSNLEEQLRTIDNMAKPEGMSDSDWSRLQGVAKTLATTKAEADKFKLSASYINLMNNSAGMFVSTIEAAAKAVQTDLNQQLKAGVINASQFATEMQKVHNIQREARLNSLFGSGVGGAFTRGGINGAVNWLDAAISARITELGDKAKGQFDENGNYTGDDKKLIDLLGKRSELENVQNNLADFGGVLSVVTGALDGLKAACDDLANMFDALGNVGAANFFSDASDVIGGVSSIFKPLSNIVSSAMSGNISGMVSGAISAPISMITAPITAFAKLHDKKRERRIQAIRQDLKRIDNTLQSIRSLRERTLGYDNGDLRRILANRYNSQKQTKQISLWNGQAITVDTTRDSAKAMQEFYSRGLSGTGYAQEYESLKKERENYMAMYDEEADKKKKSEEAMEEYKAKIAELDEQILMFGIDLAKSLWNIDFKGWADQISDALTTAFENGEDAVKAYNDTVKKIMQDVVNQMLKIGILEPMMNRLQELLFGRLDEYGNRVGGAVSTDEMVNNPAAAAQKVAQTMGAFFAPNGEGSRYINAVNSYLQGMDAMMLKLGYENGLKNVDAQSNMTNSIKGIQEQTADLLASYVNAIRADVAVDREMFTSFVQQLWPTYIMMIESQGRSLSGIDRNVALIQTMMSQGSGALYNEVADLKRMFNRVINGSDSLKIR